MSKYHVLFLMVAQISILPFVDEVEAQFPWPVTPFDLTHEITGSFCEFRDTGSADHFHNGTDIPKADGSAVYPVQSGVVTGLFRSGSNAYVRVQNKAYVHIMPTPSLEVGDSVQVSQSVLGIILQGLGHVHFTNGFVGSEANSMLVASGLTPLNDPWAPIIRYIRFYQNQSTQEFKNGKVSGPIDIVVKVDEQNGPPSSRISRRNNGIYKIGYKILSTDTASIIFEPPNEGVRFQFDAKPSNAHVHNVFVDELSSTTSHVYAVTNHITGDGFWDTGSMSPGKYVVMAFAEDTRSNADTLYAAVEVSEVDMTPPGQPTLKFVRSDETRLEVGWFPNSDNDLDGYRLFFSFDNENWGQRLDETKLTRAKTDTSFQVSLNRDIYFRLTAVDNAVIQNVSNQTDVYGSSNVNPGHNILIVDGFDRIDAGGSWQQSWHDFSLYYGKAIAANGFGFDMASNDALFDSSIVLSDYDAVVWLLGDESTGDETFSSFEQPLVKDYLKNGGMLFVSGSEIAWDLDPDNDSGGSTEADEKFLHDYLRLDYLGNGAASSAVSGIPTTVFESLSFEFGNTPYPVDSPDIVSPFGEGTLANLMYSTGQVAGVQYEGNFGEEGVPGKLVYLAFPFETIAGEENRFEVMARILNYFFPTTSIANDLRLKPRDFTLLQNFPNPFNPETKISYVLPSTSRVDLTIFDARGKPVRNLVYRTKSAGLFSETWDGMDSEGFPVASGNYFVRLQAESLESKGAAKFEKTIVMTLVR